MCGSIAFLGLRTGSVSPIKMIGSDLGRLYQRGEDTTGCFLKSIDGKISSHHVIGGAENLSNAIKKHFLNQVPPCKLVLGHTQNLGIPCLPGIIPKSVAQPFSNDCGSLHLAFEGRLENVKEINSLLPDDVRKKLNSGTEAETLIRYIDFKSQERKNLNFGNILKDVFNRTRGRFAATIVRKEGDGHKLYVACHEYSIAFASTKSGFFSASHRSSLFNYAHNCEIEQTERMCIMEITSKRTIKNHKNFVSLVQ